MSKLRSLHDRFQLLVYKFVYKNCPSTATQSSLEPQLPPNRVAFVKKKTRVVNLTTPVLKQMTIPATIWETRHCHLNMPLFYFFVRIDCQAPGRIQDLHNRGYQEAHVHRNPHSGKTEVESEDDEHHRAKPVHQIP
jgi:hypothetical protein